MNVNSLKIFDERGGSKEFIYNEIVTRDDYGLTLLTNPLTTPKLIIDIGANIGIFSLYAHELFPDAEIIAAEPDINNFNCLTDNIKGISQIKPINAALGDKEFLYQIQSQGGCSLFSEIGRA